MSRDDFIPDAIGVYAEKCMKEITDLRKQLGALGSATRGNLTTFCNGVDDLLKTYNTVAADAITIRELRDRSFVLVGHKMRIEHVSRMPLVPGERRIKLTCAPQCCTNPNHMQMEMSVAALNDMLGQEILHETSEKSD